jgi:succinate-semialdehyde dehydrogenase/glutarate-semialdehyde dehydrogenase
MPFISRNPYTEEVIREYPTEDWETLEERLAGARYAFLHWRETTVAERVRALQVMARAFHKDTDDFAVEITREMGKPIKQARAEVQKCARLCEYLAENLESMLQPIEVETDARKSYIAFQPLGVILAIMPWNFPFWQVARVAIPAIAAGNVVVLKPAPNTPTCARAFKHALDRIHFDYSLFYLAFVETEQVPDLIRHPLISAVTFTGSTRAGREVARIAGESLKKCVLELGGSDAAIILPDANLDHTIAQCVFGRYQNTGQSCIAMKRFIVDSLVYDEFVERFVEQSRALRMGDPMDEETDIGPLARADLRENLHRQVHESIGMGAEVHLGGAIPEGRGYFYPPTVLTNISPVMPVWGGGDLRSRCADYACQQPLRGGASRQRHALRAGRVGVHREPAAGRGHRPQPLGGRQRVREPLCVFRPAFAVRWRARERLRTRTERVWLREFVNIKTVYISE